MPGLPGSWRALALLGAAVAVAAVLFATRSQELARTTVDPVEVVAYWGGWSVGEDEPVFPKDLPAERLTTLIWFGMRYDPATGGCGFGGSANRYQAVEQRFTVDQSVDGSVDASSRGLRGSWRQLQLLRERNPGLKVVAAIVSPWGSGELAPAARSRAARERFAHSCVDLLIRGRIPGIEGETPGLFDGIDLDWEFPEGAKERRGYTLLLRTLRRELDAVRPGLLLTMAALASPHAPDKYELAEIHRSLDWINLMTYDQHGAWDARTNFQAALALTPGLPDHDLTIVDTVALYRAAGIPASKLVLGVPFYGRGWRGVRPGSALLANALGAPVRCGKTQPTCPARHPVVEGAFGAADYRHLVPLYEAHGLSRDEVAQQVWTFDRKRRVFWTSDDPQTLRAKMRWLRGEGLRGAMIWEITQDTDDHVLLDAVVSSLRSP